jgi:TonB family protein
MRSLELVAALFAVGVAFSAEAQSTSNANSGTTPSGASKNAFPASNPATWVTTADYPISAIRAGQSGVVSFRLVVEKDGSVHSCEILLSSGSLELDEAACSLIKQRAVFRPAYNDRGLPIRGTFTSRVRWVLPYQQETFRPLVVMQLQPSERVLVYTVELDGTVTRCAETVNGAPVRYSDTRSPCAVGGKMAPYTDSNGNPVAKVVTQRMTVSVADAPKPGPTSPAR